MKRIEAMPSVRAEAERSGRVSPAQTAARKLAYGSLDDEAAKVALAARLGDEAEVLKEATIDLARRRADYIDDRAYRLLSAAAGTRCSRFRPSGKSCLRKKRRSEECQSSELSSGSLNWSPA